MDAALITGMFNVGFSMVKEPTQDVFIKKDSDFKDVLSKSMEKKETMEVDKKDVNKKDIEKTKDDNVKQEDVSKIEDKEVENKEVNKKDEKKNEDVNEDGKEKINALVENKVQVVENIEFSIEDVNKITDELEKGLVQNVDEVGPQLVETEEITLDKFKKFEEKLDSLSEKLGISSEDETNNSLDESAEFNMDSNSGDELDPSFMLSEQNNGLNTEDVKKAEVKNKDDKFSIKDFRKQNTFENNAEQLELDVQNVDSEIPSFEITNTNNIIMSKAEKLQEQIDVLKQITEKVTVNILEDKSEMLIKLKPDNLGKVTMQIAVENGNITAKFLAESERVKEILESNMQELKDHLAKQGMAVQDLSVSVGNENKEHGMFEQSNFKTSRKIRNIGSIENTSYFSGSEIYEKDDINLAAFWPDSTVSFSA